MSRTRLPPHRCPEDRHDLPAGPATPQRRGAGRPRRPLPDPVAAGQPRPVPLPRRARPARPGLGRRARHADGELGRAGRAGCAARTGTVIISHEILAPARRPTRSPGRCRTSAGSEVHIVYSARDLGRQLPGGLAGEHQAGPEVALPRVPAPQAERGEPWFSRAFDLPDGARTVGRARPAGADPPGHRPAARRGPAGDDALAPVLPRRSASTPPGRRSTATRANESLGVAETRVLRAAQPAARPRDPREAAYDGLIRGCSPRTAGAARGRPPVTLPPRRLAWVEGAGRAWIEWIEGSGVDVVGDVEDLRPAADPRASPGTTPTRSRRAGQLDAALDALAAMPLEAARRPDPDRQLANGRGHGRGCWSRATCTADARPARVGQPAWGQARARAGRATAWRGAGARGRRSGRPARSRSRRRPRPTSPPTTGIRRPMVVASRLPATRLISSVATSAEIIRSSSGSWAGAVASAIGGAGSLRFLTSLLTVSSPSMAGQDRVADPRVARGRSRAGARCRRPSGTG